MLLIERAASVALSVCMHIINHQIINGHEKDFCKNVFHSIVECIGSYQLC